MPNVATAVPIYSAELTLIKLAREIAMDIQPIDKILSMLNMASDQYRQISQAPAFQRILSQQMEEWNAASNTAERVRLKSQAFVEEALPEFFARAHDKAETLSSKVEILKTVAKFAGLEKQFVDANPGEKFSVIINLGGGDSIRVEQELPVKVIEHEVPATRALDIFETNSELG